MNENIDLTEILKDCPKGTKLYSTIYGEVEFDKITEVDIYSIIFITETSNVGTVTSNGKHYNDFNGECTLFPSKEQRDWTKFTAPWYKKESDTIAWLEKQGNNSTSIDIDEMVIKYSQTKDGDFGLPVNCMIRAYRQGINDALNLSSCIEKQGKKSDDKIEPKFKAGDWVTIKQ